MHTSWLVSFGLPAYNWLKRWWPFKFYNSWTWKAFTIASGNSQKKNNFELKEETIWVHMKTNLHYIKIGLLKYKYYFVPK